MPARFSGRTCINGHNKPARFGNLCTDCYRTTSASERAEQDREDVPNEMLATLNQIRNLNEESDDPDVAGWNT